MRTSEKIWEEIEERLGFVPTFFLPAKHSPQVLENLWQQTCFAYLDNPLPALLKEKLSAYLSRYCAVPYCMICHSCSLHPLGVKAREVLELLESSPPMETDINKHLRLLAAESENLKNLAQLNSTVEESLLACAVFIGLEQFIALKIEQSEYCRTELRHLLGSANYQHIVLLIAYIKTCHTWMEAHPEVACKYESDQRVIEHLEALVEDEPNLANFFRNYAEKVRRDRESWAEQLAELIARKQNEEMLRQVNQELERRVQERTAELVKANAALTETNINLARSNHELEQFAYVASHDLREPLRKVKSYSDLLVKRYQGQLDEKADKYITYITDGAVRMQTLITDLLTYSRVGKGEPTLEPANLNAILNQTLRDLSTAIQESNAVIKADPLPTVTANPIQMGQLLQNLISNAIKYRGAAAPQIEIKAALHERTWTISVQDNGIGIEPQYAERIFVIFQRLHTKDEYSGTGIGLAICKKIVERHNGKIWLESELGKGSTFFFTLAAEIAG